MAYSKLAKKIEEITFKPNLTGLRRWKLIRPHTTFTSDTYNHSAYRVTLKSGDQFAIDLTAAQYGLKHSYCVPWQEYQQKRIQRVEEITPFGAQAAKFADGKNRSHYGDPLTEQILLAGYKVSDAIEAGIVREFEALEMTACKLLVSTSEDAFMDASMSMIDCGLQEAAAAKKKFGRANCFKVRVG